MPSNGAIATVIPRQIPTITFSADNYVSVSYPRYAGTHLGINTDYIVAELFRQRLHPVLLSSHSDPCPQLRHRCCMLHLILQLLFSRRKLHFRPCNSFLRRLRIYNSRILNILIRTNGNVATVITTEGNTCKILHPTHLLRQLLRLRMQQNLRDLQLHKAPHRSPQ
jgi:hypothetical protein